MSGSGQEEGKGRETEALSTSVVPQAALSASGALLGPEACPPAFTPVADVAGPLHLQRPQARLPCVKSGGWV